MTTDTPLTPAERAALLEGATEALALYDFEQYEPHPSFILRLLAQLDAAEAERDQARAQAEMARELLKRAVTKISDHHEIGYSPNWGGVCRVCAPDGNPLKSLIMEISQHVNAALAAAPAADGAGVGHAA